MNTENIVALSEQDQLALYAADIERCWALMPELRDTEAHYEIFEAVHEVIRQRDEKAEHVKILQEAMKLALNYIHHVGCNYTERGLKHPQEMLINKCEQAIKCTTEAATTA